MTRAKHNGFGVRVIAPALVLVAMGTAMGCRSHGPEPSTGGRTITRQQQATITPADALQRLAEGNRRFVDGRSVGYDYVAQREASAKGQYPFAVILGCLDSRVAPEIVFDQGIGDLFVARVAGNYAPADIIGSTEFGTKVAGAVLVMVVGHSECGAIKGACDGVELGNLTTVIQALRPAVDDVKGVDGQRHSKNGRFVQAVAEANVRRTVRTLRQESEILRELEDSGQVKLVGAMHDIATGEVKVLD